jgi:tannase/feruloyl esterase
LPYVFVTPPDAISANDLVRYMLNFNIDLDAPRIFQTSGIYTPSSVEFMSAKSTDLREFRRSKNKLIIYHGASDPVFSVNETINWYKRLMRDGYGEIDDFVRLFIIPGMNHCGGGPATDVADFLTPLVEWVERGKVPDEIVGTANCGSPWPGRTRPLCPYPKQARYKGSGDINDAANFRRFVMASLIASPLVAERLTGILAAGSHRPAWIFDQVPLTFFLRVCVSRFSRCNKTSDGSGVLE